MAPMAWSVRTAWLSLTPEPERELPLAVATLRAGGPPTDHALARERARVEKLVLRGGRRRWEAYLGEALELSEGAGPELEWARHVTREVVENHDGLALGLPGRLPTRIRNGGLA